MVYNYKQFWTERAKQYGIQTVSRHDITDEKWKEETEKWHNLFCDVVNDFYEDNKGKYVLDYGCGIGRFCDMFKALGFDYIGLDITDISLDMAKRQHPGVSFCQINPEEKNFIPLLDDRVDIIFTSTVLQHIVDSRILNNIISEFRRVLKPGGHVMLFENTCKVDKAGDHMVFRSFEKYKKLFDFVDLKKVVIIKDSGGEDHTLMRGKRK